MMVKVHCPACNLGPDNIRHFILECPKSVEVWRQLGLHDVIKEYAQSIYHGGGVAILVMHGGL